MSRIILASQSPRRKQLLEWAEIDFEVVVSNTDESFPASMAIAEVPIHIARAKAAAVRALAGNTERIIIAADTVVVLGDRIIGKPADRSDAIAILQSLSGKQHEVITGVVICKGDTEIAFADRTLVWFHALTDAQIEFYVDNYKPYDKAGAYAIQEWIGVVGIRSVEGDFYNVMGLPVSRVVQALAEI
ncbi:MAG: septum formation protein Maf [Bacteroidota bacterium]|nr:septum formation protein Maf [Bacteroidota bacterium]